MSRSILEIPLHANITFKEISTFFANALSTVTSGISELGKQAEVQLKKAESHINDLLSDQAGVATDAFAVDDPVSGKRLVVCIDGTWQSPGTGADAPSQGGLKVSQTLTPSNITKIAYLLGNGRNQHDLDQDSLAQKVYYHSGVATEVHDKKSQQLEGNFGNIHEHLLDAYIWLAKEYREGDEIYAFGFSRGATIVRSLFSFIRYAGLAKRKQYEDHGTFVKRVYEAFDLYRTRLDSSDRHAAKVLEFQENECHHHVLLKFIGVFDTVESLNVPEGYSKLIPSELITEVKKAIGAIEPNEYHDLRIGTSVLHAYHALAIDENRPFFAPMLFEAVDEQQLVPGSTREQKWFRGAHGDIGGGWWEHGLSDISLSWMIEKAREAGLQIRNLESFDVFISPLLLGTDRDYYLSRKQLKVHDFYALNPGSKAYGEKNARDLKHYMDERLFYKSSLHESVVSVLGKEEIPDNLKPFF
ncbi:UNVERIFIED_CONTAM: hypothetical protein HDU68_005497 [Siphonaria sp. JEL0065]|nr:hypothetical protein HDU68_005497 [Siphonaria sp. JEL0065]